MQLLSRHIILKLHGWIEMNNELYKEVIRNEVMPAMGCTEQGCLAMACALAAKQTGSKIALNDRIKISVDPALFKNICGLKVVGTTLKGIEAAAALGAICGNPELELQCLQAIDRESVELAKQMLANHQITVNWNPDWRDLRVEVVIEKTNGYGFALIENHHTNVVSQGFDNGYPEFPVPQNTSQNENYESELKTKSLNDLVEMASQIDDADREWIRQGIKMNQNLAYFGLDCGPVGCGYLNLMLRGIIPKCLISRAKSMIAAAVDARMDSYPLPAMSSGGSGNQGNLAILGPYLAGAEWGIEIARIEEAIAISHLVGSYLKCHVGNLSPMCGCAVTAGAGAAAAIAYLRNDDVDTIYKAIINFVGSCAGIICDGANGGCAMKVSNAAGAAIEAAMLAMEGFSINPNEGIRDPDIGRLAENLGKVGKRGMEHLNNVILEILSQKQPSGQ